MIFFAKADPVEFEIVKTRDNGSGVIRAPILSVGEIDVSKTQGGGKGKIKITRAILGQMVANMGKMPGPVPIGFENHVEFAERSGAAPGFVVGLELRGDTLWASIDLIGPAFFEVMEGLWRAFSIEGADSPTFPTGAVDGWILVGGIFTNRPAADVHFIPPALAASASEIAVFSFGLKLGNPAQKGVVMSDKPDQAVELATAKAEVEQLKLTVSQLTDAQGVRAEKIADLEREVTELQTSCTNKGEENANLEAKVRNFAANEKVLKDENARLTRQLKEAREKNANLESVQLGAKVTAMVTKAINSGLPRSVFDGFDDDPAAWFRSKFGNAEVEQLETFIMGLSEGIPNLKKFSTKPADPEPVNTKMDPIVHSQLVQMGLDPELSGVNNTIELAELLAKRKET